MNLTPRDPSAQPLQNFSRGIHEQPTAHARFKGSKRRPPQQFIYGGNLPEQRDIGRIDVGFVRLQRPDRLTTAGLATFRATAEHHHSMKGR